MKITGQNDHVRRAALVVVSSLCCVLAGCGPSVHIRQYPGYELPPVAAATCDAQIYREVEEVPHRYREIAEVAIGDSGFTIDCGRERMMSELRKQTCRLGGDAALITMSDAPDLWSSCVRIQATVIKYRGD